MIRLPHDVARCDGWLNTPDGLVSCKSRHDCQRWKSLPPRQDADRCVWLVPTADQPTADKCDVMIPIDHVPVYPNTGQEKP